MEKRRAQSFWLCSSCLSLISPNRLGYLGQQRLYCFSSDTDLLDEYLKLRLLDHGVGKGYSPGISAKSLKTSFWNRWRNTNWVEMEITCHTRVLMDWIHVNPEDRLYSGSVLVKILPMTWRVQQWQPDESAADLKPEETVNREYIRIRIQRELNRLEQRGKMKVDRGTKPSAQVLGEKMGFL